MAFPVEASAQGDEGPVLSSEEVHVDEAVEVMTIADDAAPAATQAAGRAEPDTADDGAKAGKGHLKIVK
jgi:stringent starvation protein B